MYYLPFYKVNPSGNMTVLLEGLHLPLAQKHVLASEAMAMHHLHAEQVGFIDVSEGVLGMAGNEFCVNATRSLGLVMALKAGVTQTGSWQGSVLCGGFAEPLTIKVHKDNPAHAGYEVVLRIPFESLPLMEELATGVVIVHMDGISHMLIDSTIYPFSVAHWQAEAAAMREKFALQSTHALGCIWWNFTNKKASCASVSRDYTYLEAHPVVRIASPLSECYENACGSGTLALALWLYAHGGKKSFWVEQPGGALNVRINDSQRLVADIGGLVHMVAEGRAFFAKR